MVTPTRTGSRAPTLLLTPGDGAGSIRHPIRAAEHEAEHLRRIVREGESAATPLILIGTWIALVVPLVALVVGLALLTAYLVTH